MTDQTPTPSPADQIEQNMVGPLRLRVAELEQQVQNGLMAYDALNQRMRTELRIAHAMVRGVMLISDHRTVVLDAPTILDARSNYRLDVKVKYAEDGPVQVATMPERVTLKLLANDVPDQPDTSDQHPPEEVEAELEVPVEPAPEVPAPSRLRLLDDTRSENGAEL